MRRLLLCLSTGGKTFFMKNVKNGHFFKTNVQDSNLIYLNSAILEKYLLAKQMSHI